MNGFSIVDGFMDVNECLVEMIKYVANEPSVGLFYVQQHTQNAVPNLINLREKIVEKSHERTLHTEDLEDSITMMRSMKECGFLIADEMVKDITKSLFITSRVKRQRGFQMDKRSSWRPAALVQNAVSAEQDGQSSGGYLSSVLKSAKQKAVGLGWPQFDSKQPRQTKGEELQSAPPLVPLVVGGSTVSNPLDTEADELPLSSQIADEQLDEAVSQKRDLSSIFENYEDFKADRESKLEEWLEGSGNLNASTHKLL